MANSPTYGKAQHYLAEQTSAGILRPLEADGTLHAVTIYTSNKVTDISMKPGGTSKEFMGTDGQIEGFHVSGEYMDITFTLIPNSDTRVNVLLGVSPFRVGSAFSTWNFPVLKWLGHTASGSSVITDVLNTEASAPANDATVATVAMFLQSYDFRMSLEGETTGTITLRRYRNTISPVTIT